MKLIVGLGNPGKIYEDSRHNIGFLVIKSLAKIYKAVLKKDKGVSSLSTKIKIDNQDIILAIPLTFMNLSGVAIKALLKKYEIDLENLFIICDDIDLEFGRFKIRARGSSGGHRGLESIINSVGSEKFPRLHIGIGRPHKFIDSAEYVLASFNKKEKKQIAGLLEKAIDCCRFWVREGIDKSMNIFNRRS